MIGNNDLKEEDIYHDRIWLTDECEIIKSAARVELEEGHVFKRFTSLIDNKVRVSVLLQQCSTQAHKDWWLTGPETIEMIGPYFIRFAPTERYFHVTDVCTFGTLLGFSIHMTDRMLKGADDENHVFWKAIPASSTANFKPKGQ